MLPASLYTPLYYHAMLLVVIGCALFYWAGQEQAGSLAFFNQVAMVVIGIVLLVFIGFRPVSAVFVDMPNYAWSYDRLQQGLDASENDWLFNSLMRLCSPVLPVKGFFFVCALIYIAPLAVAFWRVHGAWAFPVFLACLTALSFWPYGVNGIRNGVATSVLILSFAFHEKIFVMLVVMAAAWGLHGSVLLPMGAFLIVRYLRKTEFWLVFWGACVALTLFAGNVGETLLSRYNPLAWDARAESYIHSAGSGFRADFLAYSIVPLLVTLLLAAPSGGRSRRLIGRALGDLGSKWKQRAARVKPIGMGSQLCLQGVTPDGGAAYVGFGHASRETRGSLRSWTASGNRGLSAPGAKANRTAWERLPWVRLLQSDRFYARLVNTYLLSNALWVLVINTSFSNRFAYLSWFMMPWILLYPFIPGKTIHRPRIGLIATILCAHYLFTYTMVMVVYRLRGIL